MEIENKKLVEKNNKHLLDTARMERNIMTVSHASEFFEQEIEKVKQRLKGEIENL